MIDNYDSFTYNLVHMLREMDVDVTVRRNNKFELSAVNEYDKIMLSPGPGLPKNAGLMPELIARYAHSKDVLGICLGHQALIEHFGGKLSNLSEVAHGISSQLEPTTPHVLFSDGEQQRKVGRYHSWYVRLEDMPDELETTSVADQHVVMSFKHKTLPIHGLQFHPESILTPTGKNILQNWISS